VRLVGVCDVTDGTPAVVTGVGKGHRKNQLFVLVGQASMRVWAECAEACEGDIVPPLAVTADGEQPGAPSARPGAMDEGFAAGTTFTKGMPVRLVGVGFQGIPLTDNKAVITAVGTGGRRGQLYVQTNKGTMRVWAECARPASPRESEIRKSPRSSPRSSPSVLGSPRSSPRVSQHV
jgi:hypothetical protein